MAPWCSKPFIACTLFLDFSPSKLYASPALSWGAFLGLRTRRAAVPRRTPAVATCVTCTGGVLCQAAVVAFMQPGAQNGERARKQTPSDGALGPRSHWLSRRHAAERQQEPRGLKGGRMSTQPGGCHRREIAKARPSRGPVRAWE